MDTKCCNERSDLALMATTGKGRLDKNPYNYKGEVFMVVVGRQGHHLRAAIGVGLHFGHRWAPLNAPACMPHTWPCQPKTRFDDKH